MVLIRPVCYAEILGAPNAAELLAEYSAECALPELGVPRPQAHLYEAMERSGGMQAFGAYDGEMLVGFAVVLVWVVPHYGKSIASSESIFVTKAHRKTGAWKSLREAVLKYARAQGCAAFQYSAPIGSRFFWLLAADRKCRQTNGVFLETL